MARKALIAEPDESEAKKQAAILSDEGFEVTIANDDDDLVRLVESTTPDVIILRHERAGASGLSVVNRIKKQGVASGSSIVLTTSDLPPEAIEKHKRQRHSADRYVRLPISRKDLLEAAVSVATAVDAAEAEAEAEPEVPVEREPGRPPPLPGKFAPRVPGSRTMGAELTGEDLRFVEKVFSSIQHIDPEVPPVPESTEKLDGPDRKVALLRKNLKDRERELAKLSRLWRTREEEFRAVGERFQQKEIEIEGLKLKLAELEQNLDTAHREMELKIEEFGRSIGEQYDSEALRQAELIQEVAAKEHDLNKLRRKVDRAEEEAKRVEKELTDRVFEWERAYHDYEGHHWKVIAASHDEVVRLEKQLSERDADRATLRREITRREETIARQSLHLTELSDALREVNHHLFEEHQRLAVASDGITYKERAARFVVEEEAAELRASLFEAEVHLERNARLLGYLEHQRRAQIAQIDAVVVDQQQTITALTVERAHYREQLEHVRGVLSEERALGEAAVAHLTIVGNRERLYAKTNITHRDRRIGELVEDVERLNASLNDVTERLSNEELERSAEQARADDLDRTLAETKKALVETETRLSREVASLTNERDRFSARLDETQRILEQTKDALSSEKLARQGEGQDARLQIERRDGEIKERTTRIGELERDLDTSRTDIQTLRQTVSARDDRITELLARVRTSDEQIVALESKNERLTTTVAEQGADLEARADSLERLHAKVQEREQQIDALERERADLGNALEKARLTLEATRERASAFEQALAREEEVRRSTERTLADTSGRLAEVTAEKEARERQLAEAHADIAATSTMAEEIQVQLKESEARVDALRRAVEERETHIGELERRRQELEVERAALAARGEELMSELTSAKNTTAARDATIVEKNAALADRDRAMQDASKRIDDLTRLSTELTTKHAEAEGQLRREQDAVAARERDLETVRAERAKTVARAEELAGRLAETENLRASLEEQLASQLAENGELSATVADLRGELDRSALTSTTFESRALEREQEIQKRIAEQKGLEAALDAQKAETKERDAELTEQKSALEEARLAIDERARWVKAREARIAELEAKLHDEAGKGTAREAELSSLREAIQNATQNGARLGDELKKMTAIADQQRTSMSAQLDEAQRARASLEQNVAALETERTTLMKAKERASMLERDASSAAEKEAAQAKEIDAQRMRVEKLAADIEKAKTIARTAVHERDDARRIGAELEQRVRASEAGAASAKSMAETLERDVKDREQRLAAAQQMLSRATTNNEVLERRAAELEERIAKEAQTGGDAQRAAADSAAAEVKKLQAELLEARKQQRDAVAAAQQARAERDQLKKNAEAKLRELAAKLRGGVPAAVPAPVPAASSSSFDKVPRTGSGAAPPVSATPPPIGPESSPTKPDPFDQRPTVVAPSPLTKPAS